MTELERRAEKGGRGAGRTRPAPARRSQPDDEATGQALLCAGCRHRITTAGDRIAIDGLHEHSQVNPHGFVWTFHCYARAPGCTPVGGPTTEFTWFPGHSWQIAQC